MSIAYKHKQYEENEETWRLVDEICEGEDVVKYLIEINKDDETPRNVERNRAYKERGKYTFRRIAGGTSDGLLSLMFSKEPDIVLPAALEYMTDDVDGAGVSIFQQSQEVAEDLIRVARCGLYVSYPATDGPQSVADMASGQYRATIQEIDALQITNWRYRKVGAKYLLELVVIEECVEEVQEDGYEVEDIEQYRELYLDDNGIFNIQLWRQDPKDKKKWLPYGSPMQPTDGFGRPWDVIPFAFVGAQSNTADVDRSLMASIARLNVAHFRNCADYQDSVWFVGQAQPWMSGVTQTHIDLMKENEMYVGSREVLGVPSGEQESIDSLVDDMIGLGARYLKPGTVAKTATQSENEAAIQHSALALISMNVGEAYTLCLQWALRWMRATGEASYQPKTDFLDAATDAQTLTAVMTGYMQNTLPISDYFRWMKKHGFVDEEKTLDEFAQEVNAASDSLNLDMQA